ncbi:Tissue factor pathway inhibitor 2 [Tupaia chinensis]|uniref:Tissue factor pathway inhibitor n=1 Tax=Tupaia chinensis TaxID=246437 RepID=L9JEW1_TUPCH|nr:Tissue factor pathway inhibitor 2 [Tupaia chinensis]
MDPARPRGQLPLLLLMGAALGVLAQALIGNNSEICLLPPDEGPCRARIPSYYYDRYTQSCRQFMYGGCEGNANNFETRAACDEACWRIERNNSEICLLPPDEGPCRARIPSYYYDRYTQSCRQFMYGGCEGNANNFETRAACDEACWRIEKVPKICRLEVSKDQCEGPREEYFFNLSSMTCEKFMSGGCRHDENRFPDEATCMGFCAPKKSPSFCYSPKDEGLCSANVTRYYFNPRYKACEAFTYTGCGGNDNNFVTMKDCRRVCVKDIQ